MLQNAAPSGGNETSTGSLQRAKDLLDLVKEHKGLLVRAYGFGEPLKSEEKDVADTLWGQDLPKERQALRVLVQSLIDDPKQDFEALRAIIEDMRKSGIAIGDLRRKLERTRMPKIMGSHLENAA